MDVNKIRLIGLVTVDFPIAIAQPSDSYILKGADGFGPSGFDVFITDSAIQGGFYSGRRPLNKHLVMQVGLNPNFKKFETSGQLRDALYGMLSPSGRDDVVVQLMLNNIVVAEISGYVTIIEPVVFTKEPEVSITAECISPYFISPNAVSVVPDTKDAFTIQNGGSAPTGFDFDVTFSKDVSGWKLSGVGDEFMKFDYDFKDGDILSVKSNPDARSITLTRAGVTSNIIYALTPKSTWLFLRGGLNPFTTDTQDFKWGSISHTPKFWGI